MMEKSMMGKRMIRGAGLSVVGLAICASGAIAAQNIEQQFFKQAAQDSVKDTRLAELAQDRAANKKIQQLAKQIADHRMRAQEQLRALAEEYDLLLPERMTTEARQEFQDLSDLSGKAFDREFLDDVIADLKSDISRLKKKAEQIDDPRLQAWIRSVVKTSREHLKMAQSAAKSIGVKTGSRQTGQRVVRIPIVEEELIVGKREIEEGGARVHVEPQTTEAQKQVQLREEQVQVEREQVDRPLRPGEADQAFKERSIEMTEMREEPVITKQPRVVGEVTLKKEAEEETETIRGHVRETDVDIEQLGQRERGQAQSMQQGKGGMAFTELESDFRQHYKSHPEIKRYPYDEARKAYLYGFQLATSDRHQGERWSHVSKSAERAWEEENPGTWDQFRKAIQYGYQQSRQQLG